jgi:hypothetical protein
MTRAFVFIVLLLLPCAAWGQTPVAFWPLDELAGDIINDASGNNLHGTAYNAIIAQGIQGNCRSFDGFGDYLQVPDSDLLDITSRITIMFWAKTSQIDGIPIIKRVTGGDINYGVVFGKVKRSGDVLANGLYFQYEYLPCVLYGAYFEFCDDQWHHFAITLEFGNPASAKWIIDGVLRDGWWQYDTGAAGGGTELPSSNTYPLWIGGQNATSPGYWNGELDQIRIFDQALSEEEIDLIYNEERPENEYALGLLVQNASSLDAEETAAYAFATSHGFDVSLIDRQCQRVLGHDQQRARRFRQSRDCIAPQSEARGRHGNDGQLVWRISRGLHESRCRQPRGSMESGRERSPVLD